MVRCIAAFMNACYIARRNAISATALERFYESVEEFHDLRNIFITEGVRTTISLPRQHALKHFLYAIQFFGSPNGLCSSITESKHIKAVKEPWCRSSRFQALVQMLRTLVRMDKMAALHQIFHDRGMLVGTTSSYMAGVRVRKDSEITPVTPLHIDKDSEDDANDDDDDNNEEEEEESPKSGEPVNGTLSVIRLAVKSRTSLYANMLCF